MSLCSICMYILHQSGIALIFPFKTSTAIMGQLKNNEAQTKTRE